MLWLSWLSDSLKIADKFEIPESSEWNTHLTRCLNIFRKFCDQYLVAALYAIAAASCWAFFMNGTASSVRTAGRDVTDSIAPEPLTSVA